MTQYYLDPNRGKGNSQVLAFKIEDDIVYYATKFKCGANFYQDLRVPLLQPPYWRILDHGISTENYPNLIGPSSSLEHFTVLHPELFL